jgi:hypothetical protein
MLVGLLTFAFFAQSYAAGENKLLNIMKEELDYNFIALRHADSAELYFMSYQVQDEREITLSAELGVLSNDNDNHGRYLDVGVRVGSYELDNTHELAGSRQRDYSRARSVGLPLDNNEKAIKLEIWNETDRRFRNARKKYTNVLTNTAVKVEKEDMSDDFSHEKPSVYVGNEVQLDIDKNLWRDKVKRFSAIFKNHPEIERSSVSLSAKHHNNYFVNSEGTMIQDGQKYIRLNISCNTTAEDGMRLNRYEGFDAADISHMPEDDDICRRMMKLSRRSTGLSLN